MDDAHKELGFLRYLCFALLAHGEKDTLVQLGDRTQYVGLSDVGKGIDCMRSAVASKVGYKATISTKGIAGLNRQGTRKVLRKQLTLQRGHWQEYGIQRALEAIGANSISQLEISITVDGVPIKGHLDFTLIQDEPWPMVRILELKSNEVIPEHLHASYEAQLYGQIGMLHENWGKPCFGISGSQSEVGCEGVTFPELAQQCFGVKLPDDPDQVDLEAWVVSISMSEVKPFGPYRYDKAVLQTCYEKAVQIWNNKESFIAGRIALDEIPHAVGFHPLCEYCTVNGDCPKFSSILIHDVQYADQLNKLAELKKKEKALAKQKRHLETMIKDRYRLAGDIGDSWLTTGDYRFRLTQVPGRKSVDQELLRDKLGDHISGSEAINQVLGSCLKTGEPYERLWVSRINKR